MDNLKDKDRILLQACSMTEFLEGIPTLQDDGIRVDAAAFMACLDLSLEYTVTFFAIDSNPLRKMQRPMRCLHFPAFSCIYIAFYALVAAFFSEEEFGFRVHFFAFYTMKCRNNGFWQTVATQ